MTHGRKITVSLTLCRFLDHPVLRKYVIKKLCSNALYNCQSITQRSIDYPLQLTCFVLRVAKTRQINYFYLLQYIASITKQPKRSKTAILVATVPSTHAGVFRVFGARGTFKPLRSGSDQTPHLFKAPVLRLRKSNMRQHEAYFELSVFYT